ncbi:sugar ABC transporter ATP-binding protein [Aliiruegeria sabulilitoris]|uniref:sugar ABC transporter ATP-binding protein n=1 Tax=Aliiruegeria sabulilitoris TaxID=1510458 RepID=UPI00082A1A22|nr:sugar ABC transporter ATP-binding protein [Aliiruegeria sabulilitoris]NDR57844.1 sugar ABC transporter ATP-binding protein [Pseudoruegeria sp. M32A2M]
METHEIGLTIRDGVKVYPGTIALNHVDFDLHMGAVNVLVGENGAGKSTMMKIVAGVEPLTSGAMELFGKPVRFHNKNQAEAAGIGIVFQELNLFPNLTVAENIFIGREKTRMGIDIDRDYQRAETRKILKRLEHEDIDPDTPLGDLRIGQQQIIEIAKSLAQSARILILDEPTSALSAAEVDILFRVIRDLKADGVGIVYISHRLEELVRIGDYITVLRDGLVTGARSMEGIDVGWIVKNMIGGASKDFPKTEVQAFGAEIFRAEDITLPRMGGGYLVDHISMSVRAGEILGVYGLMGAGRSEFFECVMAQHPSSGGKFFVEGKEVRERSVAGRINRGIALIPENRKQDGLIEILSIRENITLSSLKDFTRIFHMSLAKEARAAAEYVRKLSIKIASLENPVSSLSGGNQQKVVVSKALMTNPKVLLMDEPSRGIDIGAKAEMFRTMRALTAQGLGIIFITSDLEEVMALSDRIIVMADGRISGEFDAGAVTSEDLVAASTPGRTEEKETPLEEAAS